MLDEESKPVAMEIRPGVVAADDAVGWAGQALSADQRAHGLTTVVAEMGHAMERERASRDRERRAWNLDHRMLLDRLNATREALGAVGRDFHKSAESLARELVAERNQLRLEAQAQRRRADEAEKRAAAAESELAKLAAKAGEALGREINERAEPPNLIDAFGVIGRPTKGDLVLVMIDQSRPVRQQIAREQEARGAELLWGARVIPIATTSDGVVVVRRFDLERLGLKLIEGGP